MAMTRRRKALLGVFAFLVLAVAALGVWAFLLLRGVGDVTRFDVDRPDGERPAALPDPEARTILLAGVDNGERGDLREMLASGEWQPGAFRSDAIMVLHLPAGRQRATLVSIPRDSWVPVDGYGDQKINAAFSYGGPSLLAQTVEDVIDERIQHVMVVDWTGFRGITEALGGVEVDGQQMGPEQALAYVRERKSLPNGDFDRVVRQQKFLRGMLGAMQEQGSLSSPIALTRTVDSLEDFVSVDSGLSDRALVGLGWSSRGISGPDITTLTAPNDGTGMVGDQSIVELDVPATQALFDRIVGRQG